MPHPPPWTRRVEVKDRGIRRGRGEGFSVGESLTSVSSVTVTGLRGEYHPTSSSKLKLICINWGGADHQNGGPTQGQTAKHKHSRRRSWYKAYKDVVINRSFNHILMLVLSVRMLIWFYATKWEVKDHHARLQETS